MAAARAEVDALYTPLDEVLEELKRRRADAQLVARVAEFHRLSPPTFMPAKPCAVLCRAVTSATFEVERFAGIVRDTHLQPLLLEGHGDTYASRNRDRYRLCRPSFIIDAHTVRSLRIVKLLQLEGKTV